jgi:predicted transcriptional regulator
MGKKDVRITISVSAEVAAKIDELAGRMRMSQSRMAAELLEQGIEDSELVIKFVTSVRDGLDKFSETLGRKKRKPAR